nr:Chain D, TraN [Klebsiella pneumoniae]
CSGGQNTHC